VEATDNILVTVAWVTVLNEEAAFWNGEALRGKEMEFAS
jgi:hypothetical protein